MPVSRRVVDKLRDVSEIWPKTGVLDLVEPEADDYDLIPVVAVAKAIMEGGSVPHGDVAKLLHYLADMGE